MKALVYKIHSDFYYVMPQETPCELVECKLREILKKQKIKIKVGDFVEIDEGGAIFSLLERKNTLSRPSVSNLDLVVVMASLLEPAVDFNQVDRYLIFLKYNKIPAFLCFNKDDLLSKENFDRIKAKIDAVYKPLGYEIVYTSALLKDGLDNFKKIIKGKTIAFCGASGVGKSSLLAALSSRDLRTGKVSYKTKRGCHTTRHVEIIEFEDAKIIDTPGFSRLTFDFILPKDLASLFDEISKFSKSCQFSDCLHTKKDTGCNVIQNIDKIPGSRYESYLSFLDEACEFKQKTLNESQKKEALTKINLNKNFVKISDKKRRFSRKKIKQHLGENTND